MWATLWLTLLCLVGRGIALPGGPPLSACTSLVPGHPAGPQTSPSPYTIEISPAAYLPGSTVTVTISSPSGQQFQGFFVQARRLNNDFGSTDEPIGRFNGQAPAQTQYLSCGTGSDNAWAHRSSNNKASLSTTWIAPSTNVGPLRFRMTIVQGPYTVYWTDVYSSQLASAPIVQCPSLTYSSFSSGIVLPAPVYAGFSGAVTFTYTQSTSNNQLTLNGADLPYHTITNVDSNAQFLTVTATDGTNTRTCQVQVNAFAATGTIPTVACPGNVFVDAQESNFITLTGTRLPAATAATTSSFDTRIPVNYLTSPVVNLTPGSPTPASTDFLSGTFNLGTNYIFAYANLGNGFINACFYTVTVVGLLCPNDINQASTTAQWTNPTPTGFSNTPQISYSYTNSGDQLVPTPQANGLQQFTFPGGTSVITASATNGISTATCTFQVTFPQAASLTCPSVSPVTGTSNPALVGWNSPSQFGFNPAPGITYTYNGQTLLPSAVNGQPQYSLPAGNNVITATASNNNGQMASCTFTVSVYVLNNCPADYTSATQNYVFSTPFTSGFPSQTTITYFDNGQQVFPTTLSNGQSQLTFQPGTSTTVTVTATDGFNQATCSFNVQISQAYFINNCPANYFSANQNYVFVTPTTPGFTSQFTYFANGQQIFPTTLTNGQSQLSFSPGTTTTVTVTATAGSNQATCTFDVQISQVTVTATAGSNQATCTFDVQISPAYVINNCPANYFSANQNYVFVTPTTPGFTSQFTYFANGQQIFPTTLSNGQSQLSFSPGTTTTVTVTATAGSNQATCTFDVQISQAYVINNCPANYFSANQNYVFVTPTTPGFTSQFTYFANGQQIFPTTLSNGQSQLSFSPGTTTTVTVTATAGSNQATCTFDVQISQAYVINNCPANYFSATQNYVFVTPNTPGFTSQFTYFANGQQIFPTTLSNGQSQLSFSPGTTTTVTVTATAGSNQATCSFDVQISQAPGLACQTPITTSQQTVFLPPPTPFGGFVGQPAITYSINGQTINPNFYTFNLGASTTVTATAIQGAATATCDIVVNVINVECPQDITISSSNLPATWNNPILQAFSSPTISYSINTAPISPTDLGNGQSQYGGFTAGTSTVVRVTATEGASGISDFCEFTVVVSQVANVFCPVNIVSPSTFVSWNVPTQFTGLGTSPTFSYSINGNIINPQLLNGQPTYTFTPGTQTMVTITATGAGTSATCFFTVNTLQISCPSNIVELFSLITWNPVVATGFPNAAPTITYTTNNGNTINPTQLQTGQLQFPFNQGSATTVTARASDTQGNTVSCSFNVYVLRLECPATITSIGASVSWTAPAPSGFPSTPTVSYSIDGDPILPSTQNGQAIHTFQTGITTVTATATDSAGNTISCNFIVSVQVPNPPIVTCPVDLTFDSTVDTQVSFSPATARDSNGAPLGVSYSYSTNVQNRNELGNVIMGTFPIGTTTVTALSSPDSNGLTNFCQFTVTVVGMICPSSFTPTTSSVSWSRPSLVGFSNPSGVTVNYFDDNTNVPLTPTENNGLLQYNFPSGTTTVRVVATDNFGNTAICQFVVTFNPQLPTIVCPDSQFISSQQPASVSFSPAATATDSQGFALNVFLSPNQNVPSLNNFGGTFQLGRTTVAVTTDLDSNGLSNSCSFTITVLGLRCPTPIPPQSEWTDPVPLGFNPSLISYSYDGIPFVPTRIGGLNQYTGFPLGQTTIVRVTATDDNGNVVTCVFPITVSPPTAPTIICPQDQTVPSTTGNPTSVTFQPATATDNQGNNLAIAFYNPNQNVANFDTSFTPHSGNFPVGTTTITVTSAPDGNGLTSTCSFRISVIRLQCPVVPSVSSSTVIWSAPSPLGFPNPANVFITYVDDRGNAINPNPTSNNQLQYTFPSGTTTIVTASASDGQGNVVTCSFTFTTPSATIQCPSGPFTSNTNQIQVPAPTVVGFGAGGIMTFSSGSTTLGTFVVGTSPVTLIGLELGNNIVTVSVTDGTGNTDSCIYTIIVQRPEFGPWSPWGACSLIVNSCEQTRSRVCNDPNPNDFIDCVGDSFEQRECPFGSCGVAYWDPWSLWTPCTRTCGTGTRTRTRTCNDPIPNDNDICVGDAVQNEDCNTTPCVDWTFWGPWSGCTASCNGGTRTRERRCIDDIGIEQPPNLCGFGLPQELETCNTILCPPDPVWLQWSPWSDCSARCNGGIQERTRLCSDPNPQDQIYCDGQTDLTGQQRETRPCNIEVCPEPEWYPWGPWTPCSTSCDRGFRWRTRTCFDPFDDDTETCVGDDTETDVCNDFYMSCCNVATMGTMEWL
ncbi:uncharacterized protein [Amphiura filiformis]|uniref:uncharacterized protein n=1 Tax=Amphiura filiformis TaxID=82378 RepID=UPI003B22188B